MKSGLVENFNYKDGYLWILKESPWHFQGHLNRQQWSDSSVCLISLQMLQQIFRADMITICFDSCIKEKKTEKKIAFSDLSSIRLGE